MSLRSFLGIDHEITSLNKKINAGQEVANNKEDKKSLKREEDKLKTELMLLRIGAADILPVQFNF